MRLSFSALAGTPADQFTLLPSLIDSLPSDPEGALDANTGRILREAVRTLEVERQELQTRLEQAGNALAGAAILPLKAATQRIGGDSGQVQPQLVVLDVRSRYELHSGHIPGAVHAPLPAVLKAAEASTGDKGALLVIVCEHGPRAKMARMLLKFRGYKNLQLLEGHMSHWRSSGRLLQGD